MIPLMFLYFLEIGYMPFDAVIEPNAKVIEHEILYAHFGAEVKWLLFFAGGEIKSFVNYAGIADISGMPNFAPYRIDYTVNAGVEYKFIRAGFRAFCSHPITPFGDDRWKTDSSNLELYMRFSGKIE